MKNAVRFTTLSAMLFIISLYISALIGGIVGELVKFMIVGFVVFFCYRASLSAKREREEEAGVALAEPSYLTFSRRGVSMLGTLSAPTISIVFLVSYLTSLVLTRLGMQGTTVESEALHTMIINHAIIPSILEEIIFRYIPLILIAPYSRRTALIISSVYFALAHTDVFMIPYALIAGVVFMALDIAADSIYPSLILHFLNNIVSILFIKYSNILVFKWSLIFALGVLTILSLVVIVLKRRDYREVARKIWVLGEASYELYGPIIYTIFTLFLALLGVLGKV